MLFFGKGYMQGRSLLTFRIPKWIKIAACQALNSVYIIAQQYRSFTSFAGLILLELLDMAAKMVCNNVSEID